MSGHRPTVLAAALAATLLATFLIAEPRLPEAWTTPSRWPQHPGLAAGAVVVGLLVADVVLPVPSSVVMIASGATFGFAAGTAVSTAGATLASLIAFAIGRSVRRPTREWLGEPGAARLDRALQRGGIAVVIATRPLPIVAETVAVLAGGARLRPVAFAAGALVGSLATSAAFAAAGAGAAEGKGWVGLPIAGVLAAAAWIVGERAARRS